MDPLSRLAAWSNGHPWLAGGLVLLLTVGLGSGFAFADTADISELFVDPEMPAKKAFDEVQARFELGDRASVVWIDDDPTSPRILREQAAVGASLRAESFVVQASGLAEAVAERVGDLEDASDQEIRSATQVYLQERPDAAARLLRDDALQMPIALEINTDAPTAVETILAAVDEFTTGDVIAGGYPFGVVAYDESGASDVALLLPLSIGLIALFLGALFRRPGDVVIPLATVFTAIVMTYGVMPFFGVPFSPLMFSVMPLILGLGIDYLLHIVYDYREEDPALPSEKRFEFTAARVGKPVFYTALTTGIGFGSFLVSPIPQVRYWGALIGAGALFSFLLGFLLMPALYRLTRRPKKRSEVGKGLERGLERFGDLVLTHRVAALSVVGVLTLGLGVAATQMDVERTLEVDLDDSHPYIQAMERINDRFGGAVTGLIYVRDDVPTERDDLLAFERQLAGLPGVATVDGPTTRMERLQGSVPEGEAYREALRSEALSDIVRGDAALVIFAYPFDEEELVIDGVLEVTDDAGLDAIATGQGAIQRQSQGDVLDSLIYSTAVAAGLILVLLLVVLRRPLDALITFLPLVFVVLWQFGIQGLIGIPLNAVTGVTTAMVLGVGVDYSLHLMSRFRYAKQEGKDAVAASRDAIVHVGKPVVAGSITTAAAFFVLGFSQSTQLSQFGVVAGIVVLSAFLVSLVVMPVLTSFRVKADYGPSTAPTGAPAPPADRAPATRTTAATPRRFTVTPRFEDPDVQAWYEETMAAKRAEEGRFRRP
ncbi:MAG: efflux RND transporter permease subunit [Thermoplasmatota archaeon]